MIHMHMQVIRLAEKQPSWKSCVYRTAVSYIDIDNRHLLFGLSKYQFNVPAVSVKAVTISSEPDR